MKDTIFAVAKEFSATSHGSSSYDSELFFVMGESENEFVPLSYLVKKVPKVTSMRDLQKLGFGYSSAGFIELESFTEWYKKQFGKKPDMNGILFLIGMRELGQLREFAKDEKMDLMHIATCKLLATKVIMNCNQPTKTAGHIIK